MPFYSYNKEFYNVKKSHLDCDGNEDGTGGHTNETCQVNHYIGNAAKSSPGNARGWLKQDERLPFQFCFNFVSNLIDQHKTKIFYYKFCSPKPAGTDKEVVHTIQ